MRTLWKQRFQIAMTIVLVRGRPRMTSQYLFDIHPKQLHFSGGKTSDMNVNSLFLQYHCSSKSTWKLYEHILRCIHEPPMRKRCHVCRALRANSGISPELALLETCELCDRACGAASSNANATANQQSQPRARYEANHECGWLTCEASFSGFLLSSKAEHHKSVL